MRVAGPRDIGPGSGEWRVRCGPWSAKFGFPRFVGPGPALHLNCCASSPTSSFIISSVSLVTALMQPIFTAARRLRWWALLRHLRGRPGRRSPKARQTTFPECGLRTAAVDPLRHQHQNPPLSEPLCWFSGRVYEKKSHMLGNHTKYGPIL